MKAKQYASLIYLIAPAKNSCQSWTLQDSFSSKLQTRRRQKLLIFTVVIKRQNTRYLIKLPIDISFGDYVIRGTTVRVSEKGFFVRSQVSFPVGTSVDINLHITDEWSCKLKGVIKYARKIRLLERQNGMGIELTEGDLK